MIWGSNRGLVRPYLADMGPVMRRLLIWSVVLATVLALGGCQLALPRGPVPDNDAVAGNRVNGAEIEVSSLDAPAVTTPRTADPEASSTPEIQAAPAAVVKVKTPAHLVCEKKGGRWSMAGSAMASFCQTPTKDGGKSCTGETDCAGHCLARSATCAPFTPLFGCNDILTAEGRLITQCLN
jgi:predicted small lipoprotein YifL